MSRLLLTLGSVGLLWLVAGHSDAQPQPNKPNKAPALVGWPREAKGYGQDIEAARRNALDEAVKLVRGWLKSQNPPLEAWQPDEEYVRTQLLDGAGQPGQDVKLNVGVVKEWIQPLRETPKWTEMVQLNQAAQRHDLAVERRTLAGYGLAILTALLATGWGYLRLDEWTQGRCSKWLGIGAASLLVLSAVTWWLLP